jgi:hypothetical protein
MLMKKWKKFWWEKAEPNNDQEDWMLSLNNIPYLIVNHCKRGILHIKKTAPLTPMIDQRSACGFLLKYENGATFITYGVIKVVATQKATVNKNGFFNLSQLDLL